MAYEDYNGVSSNIIDDFSSPIGGVSTRGSIFVFGTASKGETGKPVLGNSKTILSDFGEVPLDKSFDTSLVRGFLEIKSSLRNAADIYLVRVGNTKISQIDLYENNVNSTGDDSYTLVDGKPIVAMYIKSLIEGQEYNSTKVEILKDEVTGKPVHMIIELPDGTYASYNLSLDVDTPGVITKVSDLVKAINNESGFAGKIKAYYIPLTKEVDLEITDDGSGLRQMVYDLGPEVATLNESWGDKIMGIVKASYKKVTSFDVSAGSSVAELPEVLEKDMEEGQAFSEVLYNYDKASLFTVDPLMQGMTTKSGVLNCANITGWDNSFLISGDGANYKIEFYKKANGSNTFQMIPEYDTYLKTIITGVGSILTLDNVDGLSVSDNVSHNRLPNGTTITDITGNQVTLSNAIEPMEYEDVEITVDSAGINYSETINLVAGQTDITFSDVTGFVEGQTVEGANIPAGAVIAASGINGNVVTIDLPVTDTVISGNLSVVENTPNWTIDDGTGDYVINQTLSMGDQYFVSYKAKVTYAESKNRSDLKLGDPRNYFIYDTQVIFGAEQPANVEIYYEATINYESNDIQINNINKSIIEFTCSRDDLPEIGETLQVLIEHEPELPAPTGTALDGGVIQPGSFSGGSDGKITDKNQYTDAVIDGLKSVEIYPRKRTVIMGLWLDDVDMKPDYETGIKKLQPVNMGRQILPHIDTVSMMSQESNVYIPVKPLTDYTQESINNWIERLKEYSDTDLTRPANIIEGYKNMRADCPVGSFLISIPEINSGARYYANPACILAACQHDNPLNESLINKRLPGNIIDLGVKIFNADTIGTLNSKRYTFAKVDNQGRYVWADAPTLAPKNISKYDRQFVREVVYEAISVARTAAEPFIGKPYNNAYIEAMRNKVGKTVKETLLPSTGNGAISDIYVEISNPDNGSITGKSKLKMFITTSKEIRSVEIETSLQLGM